MRPLNASDVLLLSERAATSQGMERALLPLVVASPEQSREGLARLPIGRRDALLLDLYRSSFGARLDLNVECPECGENLELDLTTADLQAQACCNLDNDTVELAEGDLQVRCRLPNSKDMAAAGVCADSAAATQVLLERCLQEAHRNGEAIGAGDLAAAEVAQLATVISEADPATGTRVLRARSCGGAGCDRGGASPRGRMHWSRPTGRSPVRWRHSCGVGKLCR
jgi:hypothetical protein